MANKETKKDAVKTPAKKTVKTAEVKKETKTVAPKKATSAKKVEAKKQTKAPVKKTASKKQEKTANDIEKILTPTNNDNVILYNDQNEPMEFEQIALIPYEENLYCILRPVKLLDGMDQDQAIAFVIKEEEDNIWLDVVDNEEIVDHIFDLYYQLFEEMEKKQK